MNRIIILLMFVFTSLFLVSCMNPSQELNDFIESYEVQEDTIFYNKKYYYINGIQYDYVKEAGNLLRNSGQKVNSHIQVKSLYTDDHYIYAHMRHYLNLKSEYSNSTNDESIVKIDLETSNIDISYIFGTHNVSTSRRFIGVINHRYLIYVENHILFVLDLDSKEIIEEFSIRNSSAFSLKEDLLFVFSEGILYKTNYKTLERVEQAFDNIYNDSYFYDHYLVFADNLSIKITIDSNTFQAVSLDFYNNYLESKKELIKIDDSYHEVAVTDSTIGIGDYELTIAAAKSDIPILKGLVELDEKSELNLKFSLFQYIDELSFVIVIEHQESSYHKFNLTHRMVFKYELDKGYTYLGYVGSNEDVKILNIE